MRAPVEPLFLARRTYRRRRLMDALRLLPWLGAFLFGLPLLWRDPTTAHGLLYLFAVWAVLIVLSARDGPPPDPRPRDRGGTARATAEPMPSLNLIVGACLLYVAFLFLVAFAAEKAAPARPDRAGSARRSSTPCRSRSTAPAGPSTAPSATAPRSGLEFVTIYLGPTLVLIGGGSRSCASSCASAGPSASPRSPT